MGSSVALRELQRDLENKANDLTKLQKKKEILDIAKNHQVRKKYMIQLDENELVLNELELLKEDTNVYKLIGPVLVKQDLAEARANVRKRIEYICCIEAFGCYFSRLRRKAEKQTRNGL